MNVERVFRILWGPTLENALDFAYPVVGASPTFWRAPRPDSKLASSGAISVALITGRYYRMKVTAKYFAPAQNFGGVGLQAFIDWAADSNVFTLMPNIAVPALTVTGCYLEGPFDALAPSLEGDSTQTLDLTILHPTQDLGLAWRGLWFEYVAGQSLVDPVAFTQSRTSIKYETGSDGYLHQIASGLLADGHYPKPMSDGLQTALVSMALTNDITNPEALDNASWVKTRVTVTANAAKAPDGNLTADLLVEDTSVTTSHLVDSNAFTVVAGDVITYLSFVRAGGRFKAEQFMLNGADVFGVFIDLHAGTVTNVTGGLGAVIASKIVPLTNGWFGIWVRGTVNATSTSIQLRTILEDPTGANNYTGDGASGMYMWGTTVVHGAAKLLQPLDYTPTTVAQDDISAPWVQVPQAMWILFEFVEGGNVTANNGAGPNIGGSVFPYTRFDSFLNPGYRFSHQTATVAFASNAVGVPVVGDKVALLGIIYPDGSVECRQVINTGAETTGGRTSPVPFAAVWSNSILSLINNGFTCGLRRIKVGAFVATGPAAVTSVARAMLV